MVWVFGSGRRKSVPLNGSFDPNDTARQRVFNYSAIFDEVEDFELNIRNVSGPGAGASLPCESPPGNSTCDLNHGLLIGDNNDVDFRPCVINAFAKSNANRAQHTVTLPGSVVQVPALTALREWVRLAVRTPNGPLIGRDFPRAGASNAGVSGRRLFAERCQSCHTGGFWSASLKDFVSPPAAGDIFTETNPAPISGNPVGNQYLARFLKDINSFDLGVAGQGNPIGDDIGAVEKASATVSATGTNTTAQPDALGRDYNGDGQGAGYNVPSLLGIHASPPFYHNGACETLACVLGNPDHVGPGLSARDRVALLRFLESIDAKSPAPPFTLGNRRPATGGAKISQ